MWEQCSPVILKRISATYQDGDGTIDLVVDDMTTDTNTTQLTTYTYCR